MYFNRFSRLAAIGQAMAMVGVAALGISLLIVTLLSSAGVLPWLELPAGFGDTYVTWSGRAVQIGLTVLVLMLAIYVPSGRHVLRLEASHRDFRLGMDDITRAYEAAHASDRKGAFQLKREFDAVRERFEHLHHHPNLPEIDAELLTVAAQMSQQSRGLAEAFSEEKIARVTESLEQRRKDADELETRIQSAHATIRDVRRQLDEVEVEEASVAAQLGRLREDMAELEARLAGNLAQIGAKGRHLRPVSDAS